MAASGICPLVLDQKEVLPQAISRLEEEPLAYYTGHVKLMTFIQIVIDAVSGQSQKVSQFFRGLLYQEKPFAV